VTTDAPVAPRCTARRPWSCQGSAERGRPGAVGALDTVRWGSRG
jgi:hypothetical protein